MFRVNTTVVTVVGAFEPAALEAVDAANVAVAVADTERTALERAQDSWRIAHGTNTTYFVHDADPLAWVAEAWAATFDGTGVVGDIETARTETLARWRAKTLDLPDYYLVVGLDEVPPTMRHWYLGVLGGAAPTRVALADSERSLVANLPRLDAGRWWPSLDRLLEGIEFVVPDGAGAPGSNVPDEQPGILRAGG